MIKIDYRKASVTADEVAQLAPFVRTAAELLETNTGAGNDFTGWVKLPELIDQEELSRVKAAAEKIAADSELLVVVGIGGSYLGARAAIEALTHSFHNMLDSGKRKRPIVLYAGNNISGKYLKELSTSLKAEKSVSMSFQSQAQQQSLLWHSEPLRNTWKSVTAKKALNLEFMRQQTRQEVHSKH